MVVIRISVTVAIDVVATDGVVAVNSAAVVENMEVTVVMNDGSSVMLTSVVGSVADDTPSLWV